MDFGSRINILLYIVLTAVCCVLLDCLYTLMLCYSYGALYYKGAHEFTWR